MTSLVLTSVMIAVVLKIFYFDVHENVFRRTLFDGETVSGIDLALNTNFDNQLFLLGMDNSERVVSGEELLVTLYWRVRSPVDNEYSVSTVVVDEFGNIVGQKGSPASW